MASSEHFSLRVAPAHKTEIIISVSKKVAKKAVVRNTIKRRVRAYTRELVHELKPGSYLFVAKSGVESVKGEALRLELKRLIGL